MYTNQFWPSYLFSAVEFSVKGDMVTLHGIRPYYFYADVKRLWGSTKPVNYLVGDNVGSNYIKFERFYLHDVYFILKKMAEMHRKLKLSVPLNSITTAIKEMEETVLLDFFKEHPLLYSNPNGYKVFNKPPYGKQKEFFKVYSDYKQKMGLRGYLLDADPGTGKTATAIMLMEMIGGVGGILVACPIKAMDRAWLQTIFNELTVERKVWISTENKPLEPGYDYYLVHNEHFRRFPADLANSRVVIDRIIVDECHNFNEIGSAQTQGLIQVCDYTQANDILFMSGTPFKAMGKEVATMLRCIDRLFNDVIAANLAKTFGKNSKGWIEIIANRIGLTKFKIDSSVKGDDPITKEIKITLANGKKYTLDAVRKDIRDFVIDRVNYYNKHGKEYETFYWDCINSVKPKVDAALMERYIAGVKRLQSEGYDRRVHSDLGIWLNGFEKKVILPLLDPKIREKFKGAKTVVKYVTLKIQGEALGRILGRRRIECFTEIATGLDYKTIVGSVEKKTVFFASHISTVEAGFAAAKAAGLNPAIVHGAHTKVMPEIVQRFFDDPTINPLFTTYDSLSEAVPLFVANHIALINPPFRHHEEKQAVSRAARLGQDKQVYVSKYVLDTGREDNLSSRTLDILKWSKEQVAILTGQPVELDEFNLESAEQYVRNLHSLDPEAEMFHTASRHEAFVDKRFKAPRLRW